MISKKESDILYYKNYLKQLETFISNESLKLTTGQYFRLADEAENIKYYIKLLKR